MPAIEMYSLAGWLHAKYRHEFHTTATIGIKEELNEHAQ